jgi:predicted transcriptional regulator
MITYSALRETTDITVSGEIAARAELLAHLTSQSVQRHAESSLLQPVSHQERTLRKGISKQAEGIRYDQ